MLDGRGIRQIKAEKVEVHREDALAVCEALENVGREIAGCILECVQLFRDHDLYGVVCACQIVQTDQLRELDDRLAAQADDILQRLLYRIVQTHHDGERNKLGQAAAHRADAAAFIERLNFLVELGAVVRVLLLKLLHLRVERGHGEHALLALDGERYAAQLDDQREQDNGKAVVMHEIVQAEQDQTERSDDEITKDIGVFDQVGKLIDGHKNLQKCALWARLWPENISPAMRALPCLTAPGHRGLVWRRDGSGRCASAQASLPSERRTSRSPRGRTASKSAYSGSRAA